MGATTSVRSAETHVHIRRTHIRRAVQEQGIRHCHAAGRGICHPVLPEQGPALPGRLPLLRARAGRPAAPGHAR